MKMVVLVRRDFEDLWGFLVVGESVGRRVMLGV